MRQAVKITTVYTIETHPNPESVFDWIRNNWHDLGEHSLQEAVESAKALADHVNATPDWSICITGSRGDHVSFSLRDDDRPQSEAVAADLLNGSCPLTGVCYDESLLDAFRQAKPSDSLEDTLKAAGESLLSTIHKEGDYIYSDEGLREMCEANEYEFTESGVHYV